MAEYRLAELARLSGISARNIRAYRERGLLEPPRRVGRAAYYDDSHLAQLETISQLLRKGFSSAHITDFFASFREGADLADYLGLQHAVLGAPQEQADTDRPALDIGPASDEARTLIDAGLAERAGDAVILVDRKLAEIIERSGDQQFYLRALVEIAASTRAAIDEVAGEVIHTLESLMSSRFGADYLPRPDEIAMVSRILQDYHDLAGRLVAERLDIALRHHMVTAASEHTAGILHSGRSEPRRG